MKYKLSRRRFIQSLGAFATASLASPFITTRASNSKEQLTMVTWGGTTGEAYKNAVAEPFTKKTGIPVQVIAPVNYAKYTTQLKQGKIKWDWVDIEGFYAYQEKKFWLNNVIDALGLGDMDFIKLPGVEQFPSWGVPSGTYSFAIAYRTDHKGPHPKSWSDFFDPGAVAGRRAIYNWPYGMLEAALLGDGVPFKSLYPLDIDRALSKLENVRDHLIFWNSGAELQRQLVADTAPFAFSWNNRVAYLAQRGQPVDLEWNDNIQDGGFHVIAEASPRLQETKKLVKFTTTIKAQTQIALKTGYSPSIKSSLHNIPDTKLKWYNVYEPNMEKAVGSLNQQWWAKNMDKALKEWNKWASS